jgi:hypothetical protein
MQPQDKANAKQPSELQQKKEEKQGRKEAVAKVCATRATAAAHTSRSAEASTNTTGRLRSGYRTFSCTLRFR